MTLLVHVDDDIRCGGSDDLSDNVDNDSLTLFVLMTTWLFWLTVFSHDGALSGSLTVRLRSGDGNESSENKTGLHVD